ncbi:MAG TPA: hypothetical protein PLV67_05690 [Methanofastidiosum sp.]|nr:hypothetical protein [Methanofastidiosum sp.]
MLIENFLFTEEKFKNAKSRDLLPCKCKSCDKIFYRAKNEILTHIKHKFKYIFCSSNCSKTYIEKTDIKCEQCGKEITIRKKSWIKRSKHHFCSQSCAAKYHNAHKTSGFRRSKLEKYLEAKLTELYPDIEILYNDRNTLDGLELDIYIPSLKLAFELNGVFHIIPVFGKEKLENTQNNDYLKLQKCQELNIVLCVIDISKEKRFTEKCGQKYLDIIKQVLI